MALYRSDSTPSDDEEAPESVSLVESRRDVQKHADSLKQFREAEKEKKRTRNREKDRRLKEQAEHSRRRRYEVGESGIDLEARMKRAMDDAEAELDSDEGDDQHREGEEEFQGIVADLGDGQDSSESDDGADSEVERSEGVTDEPRPNDEADNPITTPNPNHLPDHLFTSAFTSHAVQSTSFSRKRKMDEESSKHRAKKRTRKNNPSKDVVVGSRTIRTLVQDQYSAGAGTIPSSKVTKFINRTLALKGGGSNSRGWERRAANIGIMRRSGPAANFVRSR